jgi:hypothetical protein
MRPRQPSTVSGASRAFLGASLLRRRPGLAGHQVAGEDVGHGQLVLYGLGMGAVAATLTLLVAVLGRGALGRLRGAGRVLHPASALLLLATGGYIVYYWLAAGGLLG